MPRKRTHGKRRLDPYSGAEAWSDVFQAGYAMFDDFSMETGVATLDRIGHVPREAAEEAWRAYGAAFLALYGRAEHWALQQFGEPAHAV